jgi:hypothetical protein
MEIIFFIPLFIVAAFLAFYIPGRVILGTQKNLSNIGIFALSFILGIVLWAWQGYVFGFLQLRWLSYVYLLVFLGVFIKKSYYLLQTPQIKVRKLDWLTIFIAAVGIIAQIIPHFRNGETTSLGVFITNNNSPDQVWHAALVEELLKRFPPFEPGMFGIYLNNYHFWFNLVTADLIRVFHLPLFQTTFIGMYSLIPFLLALIVYSLATSIYNSKLFIRFFMFFVYFSGDAVLWFLALTQHKISMSLGWLFEDGTNFMDTPGRGVAVVIVFAGLLLLFKNKEKISWRNVFIIGLLFGSLVEFKIYIGIPFLIGLFGFSVFHVLKKKLIPLVIFIVASVFTALQFLPFSSSGSNLFFLPFDIPREFMAQSILASSYFDLRWTIYFQHHNYLRLLEYGIIMSVIYFIVQFGIKLFGFFPLRKTIKTLGFDFSVFLYSVFLSSLILGLFFYQKIGGANIWEFFLPISVILSIMISLNLALYLPKNKFIKRILILLIVVIVIPRWFYSLGVYFKLDYFSGFHGIYNSELESYSYFRNNTPENSLVLFADPPSYTGYASLASIFSDRNLFLSGEGVSQVVTSEISRRRKDVKIIKTSIDVNKVDAILKKDNINYIYLNSSSVLPVSTVSPTLREVFSNKSGKIFKVD